MKFPSILESWQYRDPCLIGDGLIARAKHASQPKKEDERQRRDRYYTQSRSIRLQELVRSAKNGGNK